MVTNKRLTAPPVGKFYVDEIKVTVGWLDSPLRRFLLPVLNDDRFTVWPASVTGSDGRPPQHHGEKGGLARHTLEVLQCALAAAKAVPGVDRDVLIVGAIWHDFGKIDEYYIEKDTKKRWLVRRNQYHVSHICRGLMLWDDMFGRVKNAPPEMKTFHEGVAHLIASHHGRKEWGSPVVPQTIEALLLHHADMVSVMMDSGNNPTGR